MSNAKIENKIKKTRIKLFRQDSGLQFFGACAYKFDWKVHDMSNNVEGFVRWDKLNMNCPEDGTIHMNEDFLSRDDYTHENIIALVVHELLHILEKHGMRMRQRDPKLWNVAADHVVDRTMREIGSIVPYNNQFNIIPTLHSELPKCTAEQAYIWLKNNQDKRVKIDDNPQEGDQTGEDQTGEDQTGEDQTGDDNSNIHVRDMMSGEEFDVVYSCGGPEKSMSQDDKIKVEQTTEQFISQARALYETMKDKGLVGGSLKDYLQNILKVEIPWDTLLEKAIKTNTVLKPDGRSWQRLNIFYRPHNITLPGYSLEEDNEGVGTLILTVDTSASISMEDLKKFGGVIYQSMKYFKNILVLTHDSELHQVREFTSDNIMGFLEFLKDEGLKGRGGTSHRDVFKYIEDNIWQKNDKKDELSMVISLTDGFSDIPSNIYHKWITNNTPLVFVIQGRWNYNFNMDNIELIHIN